MKERKKLLVLVMFGVGTPSQRLGFEVPFCVRFGANLAVGSTRFETSSFGSLFFVIGRPLLVLRTGVLQRVLRLFEAGVFASLSPIWLSQLSKSPSYAISHPTIHRIQKRQAGAAGVGRLWFGESKD